VRSMKTKVESVAAGEDKETGLDVEACGVVVVVLEGELRCVRDGVEANSGFGCGCARVMAERTIGEE